MLRTARRVLRDARKGFSHSPKGGMKKQGLCRRSQSVGVVDDAAPFLGPREVNGLVAEPGLGVEELEAVGVVDVSLEVADGEVGVELGGPRKVRGRGGQQQGRDTEEVPAERD